MNLCKNYSQSSIDLYNRSLVESSIELEERCKSLPLAKKPKDSIGYGYVEREDLPQKFPYELESTVCNPMASKLYVKGVKKRRKRRKPLWQQIKDCCRRTKICCGRFCRCLAFLIQHGLLIAFWFWVCISLINLFKTAEMSFDKRHAVVPKTVRYPEYQYHLTQLDAEEVTVNLKLHGPFIPYLQQNREYNEDMMSSSHREYVFICCLERWTFTPPLTNPVMYKLKKTNASHVDYSPTAIAKIMMINDTGTTHREPLDYNNYPRSVRLAIPKTTFESAAASSVYYALGFSCEEDQEKSVPFSMEYRIDPISMRTRVLLGLIPLVVLFMLVILQVNRGVAAYLAMATALAGYVKTGAEVEVNQTGQWLNADIILFAFASMLIVSILAETKLYTWFAWHFLKLTGREIRIPLLFLNIVTALFAVFFNNIFIALIMAPLAISMMELMDRNPYPVVMNLMMICNICGKAYVGTFIVREILIHTEAINAKINLYKIMAACLIPSLIVAFATCLVWAVVYALCRPQVYRERMAKIEVEQELILWKRLHGMIPDISKNWHYIRQKITMERTLLKKELERQEELPPPEFIERKSMKTYKDMFYDFRVYNWFLVIRVMIAIIAFVVLTVFYIYHIDIAIFNRYGDMKIGFLGLYAALLLFLLLHSRDFELLLKRIDWQALLIIMSFGIITSVFVTLTGHMDDFLWKMYGATAVGSRKRKVHMIVLQIISYTSVSGVCNEHSISVIMLDTILTFSVFRGFNAVPEILGGFIMATGFWGNASILGTFANIVVAGFSDSQGYKARFFHYMWYGVPVAVLNVGLLYVYIGFSYLI